MFVFYYYFSFIYYVLFIYFIFLTIKSLKYFIRFITISTDCKALWITERKARISVYYYYYYY